jgi:DNA-binding response OmpR family regulator
MAVITDDDDRSAELVLWSVDAIDENSVRVTMTSYQPTPVLVILAASMHPTSTQMALCLNLGAHQCLIEPSNHELVAHINAIVRRLRHPPTRGAATQGAETE